jgi:hypothetical protein
MLVVIRTAESKPGRHLIHLVVIVGAPEKWFIVSGLFKPLTLSAIT